MDASKLIHSLGEDNAVRDESLFTGHAFTISSPRSIEEVCEIVRYCAAHKMSITPHGGLTGINGAGTASYNHRMDLRKLNNITYCKEDHSLWAESGATFSEIESFLRKESNLSYEFPASPTEKSATIGGALSFNAHGLRSYKYGGVSQFVTEIEYCDNLGTLHQCTPADPDFQELLGSEGMFAIITRIHLRTIESPAFLWGLMFFFPGNLDAAKFADAIPAGSSISVFEFCDHNSFELLQEFRSQISSLSRLPDLPTGNLAAIYLELECESEEDLELSAETLLLLSSEYGCDPDTVWSVEGEDVETFRLLRHTISECINLKIATYHAKDVRIKKLSCSCFFPDKTRHDLVQDYQNCLAEHQLSGILFGHIGSGNLYVNILASSATEYFQGLRLIENWCQSAYKTGGYAFSECGVGKLYRDIFYHAAPIDLLNKRIKLKQKWDPQYLFNPENMLLQL